MNRRRSRLVALVALLTLLVSTTETVWASACAPEMRADAPAREAAASAPEHGPDCAGSPADSTPAKRSSPERDATHCPLLALAGGGSCLPASLPARPVPHQDASATREALLPRTDGTPDLLLSAPPVPPPEGVAPPPDVVRPGFRPPPRRTPFGARAPGRTCVPAPL